MTMNKKFELRDTLTYSVSHLWYLAALCRIPLSDYLRRRDEIIDRAKKLPAYMREYLRGFAFAGWSRHYQDALEFRNYEMTEFGWIATREPVAYECCQGGRHYYRGSYSPW